MPMSIDEILIEAQALSNDSKAILAEKLIDSIEQGIDPQITKNHLAEIKRRRDEIHAGIVQPLDGEECLIKVREIIGQ